MAVLLLPFQQCWQMLRQGVSRKDPRRSAFPVPQHAWTAWGYDSRHAWHRRGMLWRNYFWMAWRGLGVGLGLVVVSQGWGALRDQEIAVVE